MIEVLFLDGSIDKINKSILRSYLKLHKGKVFAYRQVKKK